MLFYSVNIAKKFLIRAYKIYNILKIKIVLFGLEKWLKAQINWLWFITVLYSIYVKPYSKL